ncbi:hypothetical protein D3C72_1705580 [compost metagenome]
MSTSTFTTPAALLIDSDRCLLSATKSTVCEITPLALVVVCSDTDDSTPVLNLARPANAMRGGTALSPSTVSWNALDRPAMALRSVSVSSPSVTSIWTARPSARLSSVTATFTPLAVVMRSV